MALSTDIPVPKLPFAIYQVAASLPRYLVYDICIITWLRKTHRILGVLVGTLPQIPQQNVFLGLPLQLAAEEARWLVEQEYSYIVNDQERHLDELPNATLQSLNFYKHALEQEGREAAASLQQKKASSKHEVSTRPRLQDTPEVSRRCRVRSEMRAVSESSLFFKSQKYPSQDDPSHDNAGWTSKSWAVTPTTAEQVPKASSPDRKSAFPLVKESSYSLYKLLHSQGYFISPGLRFGCSYMAYPNDPLRFHSHFLAIGAGWDEELNLLDIVGGGRLGTGVKKGYLLGGLQSLNVNDNRDLHESRARAFCIEWGGM